MLSTKKRKLDSTNGGDSSKRLKMTTESAPIGPGILPGQPDSVSAAQVAQASTIPAVSQTQQSHVCENKGRQKENATEKVDSQPSPSETTRKRIIKLVPPRPFPTVPTSVSATGPRSSHREGENYICLTRKTPLGAYLRRCKDVIIKDGYKTLYLSAMGAAIPHLLQLVCALPPILPFPPGEIHQEIKTGTVEVQDEIHPDDDDEDITYQTRGKSTLLVVIKIGDGEFEGDCAAIRKYSGGKSLSNIGGRSNNPGKKASKEKGKAKDAAPAVVFEEPEQEFMDML